MIWFHMEERGVRKPIDEFFHIWDKFLRDVQVAHKAHEQQELKEKRKSSMPPRRATMHAPREKERGDRLRSLTPRRSLKDGFSSAEGAVEDAPSSNLSNARPRFASHADLSREHRAQSVEQAEADVLAQQTFAGSRDAELASLAQEVPHQRESA